MPGLPALNALRAWTGFRPATLDGLPLIGPALPGSSPHPDTWLAVGHEGLGVTTALGTAKLIAAQMLGHDALIDSAPYLPARLNNGSAAHG